MMGLFLIESEGMATANRGKVGCKVEMDVPGRVFQLGKPILAGKSSKAISI